MSTVFFLFLLHLSLGVLATLPFVPGKAGRSFFKFSSAASVFMSTAALWLVYRRYGLGGAGAPGGAHARTLLVLVGCSLLFAVLYNRAWHFGWRRAYAPLLAGALACGAGAIVVGATDGPRALVIVADVTSVVLLGAAASAMVLGHWYLVVLDLPIAALRRLTVLLGAGLLLRAVAVALVLAGPAGLGYVQARAVAVGLWSPDGVFVWMRLLFGIVGPLSLLWFIWKTVEIRSTQSATGILYVQLFLVLAGELLAKYLRVAAGYPL
jgi:protein NrfD